MIQKYCRNWKRCESNPIIPGSTWLVVEVYNPELSRNDEIFVDEEQGKVFLHIGEDFYEDFC